MYVYTIVIISTVIILPYICSCCTETVTDNHSEATVGVTDNTQSGVTDSTQGGSTDSTQDGSTDSDQGGGTDNKVAIASGTVIGSLIVVILAALLAVQLIRMFRKKQHHSTNGKTQS